MRLIQRTNPMLLSFLVVTLFGGCPPFGQNTAPSEADVFAAPADSGDGAEIDLAEYAKYLRSLPDVILPEPPPAHFGDAIPQDIAGGPRPSHPPSGGSAGNAAGVETPPGDEVGSPETPDDNQQDSGSSGGTDAGDGSKDDANDDGDNDPPPPPPRRLGDYFGRLDGRSQFVIGGWDVDPNQAEKFDIDFPIVGKWEHQRYDVAAAYDASKLLTVAMIPGFHDAPNQIVALPATGETVELDATYELLPGFEAVLQVTVVDRFAASGVSVLRVELHFVGTAEGLIVDVTGWNQTRLVLNGDHPRYESVTRYEGQMANSHGYGAIDIAEDTLVSGTLSR